MLSLSPLIVWGAVLAVQVVADDCQPWTWKRQAPEEVGTIECRYETTISATESVNYYTCTELALRYGITVEQFFMLNPSVATDCSNLKNNATYCVRGCKENHPPSLPVHHH